MQIITKTILFLGASAMMGMAAPDAETAKRQCRSVHLGYKTEAKVTESVELYYNEMQVEQSAPGSYFMGAGFTGGYSGIQELSNGKKVALFSVWDPGNPHDLKADKDKVSQENRVIILGKGENVRTRRFGGEGTGAQSMIDFDWKIGETYQFIITAKPAENPKGTTFSCYIKSKNDQKWQFMATFHTKIAVQQVKYPHTFVEDFRRNYKSAKLVRKAHYGNAWIRTSKGNWHQLTKAKFTADGTPSNNINAGISKKILNGFFLQTGGDTKNVTKLWSTIEQPKKGTAKPAPPIEAMEFPKP